MSKIRIALAQLNVTVGDFDGNLRAMGDVISRARAAHAAVVSARRTNAAPQTEWTFVLCSRTTFFMAGVFARSSKRSLARAFCA